MDWMHGIGVVHVPAIMTIHRFHHPTRRGFSMWEGEKALYRIHTESGDVKTASAVKSAHTTKTTRSGGSGIRHMKGN